jgi:hypothetical protein
MNHHVQLHMISVCDEIYRLVPETKQICGKILLTCSEKKAVVQFHLVQNAVGLVYFSGRLTLYMPSDLREITVMCQWLHVKPSPPSYPGT